MRILICDDDPLMLEQLRAYVTEYFEAAGIKCPEIACFGDGAALLGDTGEMDLLFLDIEMPGPDGIFIGKSLKQKNENLIVFIVTSHSEYLDDAMRFHVFRYLSKPLDRSRLFCNLKDAVSLYHSLTVRVPVETRQGVHTLPASSIIAVEAQRRKVIVHAASGDFESIRNMQYWRGLLPKNSFFQSHRSFIVNFRHVTDFDHSLIHLADGQMEAYLTKRNYYAFKEAYLLYLESTR